MESDTHHLRRLYYKNYFPVEKIWNWLKLDEFRELSFCKDNKTYIRFLTFENVKDFWKELISIVPSKIDVGGIYKYRPIKHNTPKPIKKELVFDIDLTDYERKCCTSKMVCNKCFVIIKAAIKLLNYSLKEEFGFKNVNFVFSGRRGCHCWVTDTAVLDLSDAERGDIVKYYQIVLDKKVYPEEYKEILEEYSAFFEESFSTEELFSKLYVKLDENVTKYMGHLIKMPFCVHPDSGLISVPIDPSRICDLKLEDLPGLEALMQEPTLLNPYIDILDSWF